MLKERNWIIVWLLSMATGGIYTSYLIFIQLQDLKAMDEDREKNYLLHLILFCLLFVFTFSLSGFIAFWIYQRKAVKFGKDFGVNIRPHSGFIFALLSYVPIFSYWLVVNNHNKLISSYKKSISNVSYDNNTYITVE